MDAQFFFNFEAVELACPEEAGEEQVNGWQTTNAHWRINARHNHRLGRLRASDERP